MYAKCGALAKAQQVLKELPVRDVVTWNALIAGYAREGQGEEALKCYDSMQIEGHYPDVVTFTCALKACGSIGAADKGKRIHSQIVDLGILEKTTVLGNTLVDMYAKCGQLIKAQQVLEELPVRNVVTWNALIAGYAQKGQGEKALECYNNLQHEGYSPNTVTFICALKACGSIRAGVKGKEIHDKVVSLGMLKKDIMLGNMLVDMYAKSGAVAKAQKVLEELPIRDVVSWNALIAGHAEQGQGEEALRCFESMQHEGHSPDAVTFTCALKACGRIQAVAKGEQIHDRIARLNVLKKDMVLGSILVDMYVKCGALQKAQQVMEELHVRDVAMWNVLITGYSQQGQGKEALKCYDNMQCEGHSPSVVTFISVLKACGSIGATAKGEQIHEKVVDLGMLKKDIFLGIALIDMYAKCGAVDKSQQVLEELPVQDVVMWNAVMAGYLQQGQGAEALKCYERMQSEGHSADAVAFICALKACGSIEAATKGEQIHVMIMRLGMLEKEIILGSILVDMYVRCGALAKAQQVFEVLRVRDIVAWSSLIAGYVQQGQEEEALNCYDNMQREHQSPNVVIFVSVLRACGSIGAIAKGEQIHDDIVSLGMLEKDNVVGVTLVDMYAKCGALAKAQQVLEVLSVRSVATWTVLIMGFVQQGQGEEALKYYQSMRNEGHSPDAITFICALKACGSIGAAAIGKQIHDEIVKLDMLSKNILLGSILVDMYAKCGALTKAQQVLKELPVQDVVTWNALIGGYALQGQNLEALNCLGVMQSRAVKPDSTTLLCVLIACSHAGLSHQAGILFSRMSTIYSITPDFEHYCCMVDLFGRAGMFNEALVVIEKLPSAEHQAVWVVLLGACHKCGQMKIGRLAFEHAVHLDKRNTAIYVCMDNIYAAASMQDRYTEC